MSVPGVRRRRGPRRALTDDEILDAALDLLDEGGPDAASVRGLAARVGVAPNAVYTSFPDQAAVVSGRPAGGGPAAAAARGIAGRVGVAPNAVYTYFPDKAAVVKGIVERLLAGVDHDVFADRERPWRERVEALALELRAHLSAHPGAVPLMIGGPMDGPHVLALNERLLDVRAAAGLDPPDAARAAYLLIVYVFGSIALEVADVHRPGPLPPEAERVAARQGGARGAPPAP